MAGKPRIYINLEVVLVLWAYRVILWLQTYWAQLENWTAVTSYRTGNWLILKTVSNEDSPLTPTFWCATGSHVSLYVLTGVINDVVMYNVHRRSESDFGHLTGNRLQLEQIWMEQSPFWQANSSSSHQEIPRI